MTDTNAQTTAQALRFRNAYQQALPEIMAVPQEQVQPITVDVMTVVSRTLGAVPGIRALRDQAAQLPFFDIKLYDNLELCTLALGHAHTLHLAASEPAASLPALSDEGTALRELLLTEVQLLVKRGFVDANALKELKGPVGYKILAQDLFLLTQLIRVCLDKLVGKTLITEVELDRAEVLGDLLTTTYGEREQGPAVVGQAAETRMRAFALFERAYAQVRRAIQFLRHEERDADEIAPSPFIGRGPSGHKKKDDEQTPDTHAPVATPVAPVAAPVNGAQAAPAAVGLPGSDPFGRV